MDAIPIILLLIFLEGILSIDNAAVLGAMVAHLPRDREIPWPKLLRPVRHFAFRTLGYQQGAALKVGLLGAYFGRGLMLALAFIISKNDWILLIGAAYLFWLGISHFAGIYRRKQAEEEGHTLPVRQHGFWMTVLLIEIADLAFSLDNVVVAVQIDPQRRFWVIALGVGIGIVIMRFAAGIFTRLIQWEPNLEHAAFALLLAIGLETMLKAVFHIETPHELKFIISMLILAITVLMTRVTWLGWLNKLLHVGLPLAAAIYNLIALIFRPVRMLFELLLLPFRSRTTPKPMSKEKS